MRRKGRCCRGRRWGFFYASDVRSLLPPLLAPLPLVMLHPLPLPSSLYAPSLHRQMLTTSIRGFQGIALPVDQFSAIIQLLPHIESVLKGKGIEVARPVYDAAGGDGDEKGEEEKEEVDEGETGKAQEKAGKGTKRKKNFEATSEEEEGV